jgi:hypothetical protein
MRVEHFIKKLWDHNDNREKLDLRLTKQFVFGTHIFLLLIFTLMFSELWILRDKTKDENEDGLEIKIYDKKFDVEPPPASPPQKNDSII